MNEFAVGERVRMAVDHRLYRIPKGMGGVVQSVAPGLIADGFTVHFDDGRSEMVGARHLEKVGATVVPGAAPKAGTELARERMAENLRSLNTPWRRPPEIDADLPLEEMRQLARIVWDDGSYGEPASTLASYVLALLGEPPFPSGREMEGWIGSTDAEDDERRRV